MLEAKRVLVQSWLTKASEDLGAAKKLTVDTDSFLSIAIYHCQQCAEKVVKGFLVYHDTRFGKTHDISELAASAMGIDVRFSAWSRVAKDLTPYATEFRYPSRVLRPTRQEFDQALQDAEQLYDFVLSLLPSEVHP